MESKEETSLIISILSPILIALSFMEIEPQAIQPNAPEPLDFAEPPTPLSLNYQPPPSPLHLKLPEPVDVDVPPPLSAEVMPAPEVREWRPLRAVSDRTLRSPRIQAGLTFVGFGALGLVFLLLYTRSLHPEFDWVALVSEYWYPYVGCASLGVAGLIVLGRESLRP